MAITVSEVEETKYGCDRLIVLTLGSYYKFPFYLCPATNAPQFFDIEIDRNELMLSLGHDCEDDELYAQVVRELFDYIYDRWPRIEE